jgi:hypothetical protein
MVDFFYSSPADMNNKNSTRNKMIIKMIIGIAIGGLIGFAVGYFGKCASGTCPLTSNPTTSTILGALFGAIIAAA